MKWEPNHIYLEEPQKPLLAYVRKDFLDRAYVSFEPGGEFQVPDLEYACRYVQMVPTNGERHGTQNVRVTLWNLFGRMQTVTKHSLGFFSGRKERWCRTVLKDLAAEGVLTEICPNHYQVGTVRGRCEAQGMKLDDYAKWFEETGHRWHPGEKNEVYKRQCALLGIAGYVHDR